MPSNRKWLQFSLRSLAIATFILGPVVGTWIHYVRLPSRDALSAVNELKARGWSVQAEWRETPSGATWWGKLLGIGPMPDKCVLGRQDKTISDEEMRAVATLGSVDTLVILRADVSPRGLQYIGSLRDLRIIEVSHTRFGDAECELFSKDHLILFLATNTRISDQGLKSLAKAKELKCLALAQTQISDAGLATIGTMTNLTDLDLHECPITDQGITELAGLGNLENLVISETKVTSKCLKVFENMDKLSGIEAVGLFCFP